MQEKFVPTSQMRMEKDALGEVPVPETAYWGAQTERSRHHFPTDGGTMPLEVIYALARIKKAAAEVNVMLGVLDERRAALIEGFVTKFYREPWTRIFHFPSGKPEAAHKPI